jgi:hypothetical protein
MYTHYPKLSTVQANWGLKSLGRQDTNACVVFLSSFLLLFRALFSFVVCFVLCYAPPIPLRFFGDGVDSGTGISGLGRLKTLLIPGPLALPPSPSETRSSGLGPAKFRGVA